MPRTLVDYVNQLAPTDSTAGKEASNLDYRLNFFGETTRNPLRKADKA
ncbi:MAG: hypothetical protein ABSA50_09735 [Candidatus Bathyarchaeia archaeon]